MPQNQAGAGEAAHWMDGLDVKVWQPEEGNDFTRLPSDFYVRVMAQAHLHIIH